MQNEKNVAEQKQPGKDDRMGRSMTARISHTGWGFEE
jgi:hypothetical protein